MSLTMFSKLLIWQKDTCNEIRPLWRHQERKQSLLLHEKLCDALRAHALISNITFSFRKELHLQCLMQLMILKIGTVLQHRFASFD